MTIKLIKTITMESIRTKQVRCLREAVKNGRIFSTGDCISYLKSNPLGKDIKSIEFKRTRRPKFRYSKVVEVKGSIFTEVCIDFGHTSQSMYTILKDGKIIYFDFSSVYAPASNAFETLTEVYLVSNFGVWEFHSEFDCKVYNHKESIFTKLNGKARVYETKKLKDATPHVEKMSYWY